MNETPLDALQDAIRHTHGVESTFVERVPLREAFGDATVWEGEVCVFDLVGHPKAARAYAWSHATDGTKRRFYAVLHLGPVDSPIAAVRAAIVADERKKRN